MGLFLRKAALLLPIPVFIVCFTWWMDPAHLTRQGTYERGIADLILQGHNVTNISENYDDRIYLRYYVAGLQAGKQVLVLGSSRAMLIRSPLFPGRTFFNNSVSAGMVEDHMAIYQMYRARHFRPDLVVLSVDPWNLNRFAGSERWQAVRAEYDALETVLSGKAERSLSDEVQRAANSKYAQLLSPSYFQYSMATALTRPPTREGYRTVTDLDDRHLSGLTRLSDGSVIYAASYRTMPAEQVRAEAIEFGRQPTFSHAFTALDPALMRKFEAFIDLMTLDGSKVVLELSPFHPKAYETMLSDDPNRIVEKAEDYFVQVARTKHLSYLGSFNPAALCFGETDFYDAYHPNDDAIDRIMQSQTCATH